MADILDAIFGEALKELVTREHSLVRRNVHEQAICGRLSKYVEVAKDSHGLGQYYVDRRWHARRLSAGTAPPA
jgi:hypothetical protein